jgi:hypothetical protein
MLWIYMTLTRRFGNMPRLQRESEDDETQAGSGLCERGGSARALRSARCISGTAAQPPSQSTSQFISYAINPKSTGAVNLHPFSFYQGLFVHFTLRKLSYKDNGKIILKSYVENGEEHVKKWLITKI